MNEEKKRITEEIIVLLKETDQAAFNDMIFVKKLEMANINLIDGCKQDFFNAELVEYTIRSKGDAEKIKLLENLKLKFFLFGKLNIDDIKMILMGMNYFRAHMRE